MNKGLDVLTNHIEQWAKDRNLHTADPTKQMLKFGEESGELYRGLVRGDLNQVKDAIGDVYVVITILSMQMDLDIEECIKTAYAEIADRKGKMVDGVFIKESDLEEN